MNKNNQDNIDYANGLIAKTRTQPRYWLDVVKMVRTASDIIKQQAVSLDQWIRMSEDAADLKDGNYWSWQGDGEDHLESMSCEMKVVISANELKAIIDPSKVSYQAIHENDTMHSCEDELCYPPGYAVITQQNLKNVLEYLESCGMDHDELIARSPHLLSSTILEVLERYHDTENKKSFDRAMDGI